MKLDNKIRKSKITYLLTKEPSVAFELALLYYLQATRKTAQNKILGSCQKSLYWLKTAGIVAPMPAKELDPAALLAEIEKLLVANKTMVCRKAGTLVRAIPVYSHTKDFGVRVNCRDFGLAY